MTVFGWMIVLAVGTLMGTISLIVSLFVTNPLTIGPLGVTLWFVVLFLTLASVIALIFVAAKSYLRLHATNVSRLRYSWRQGMLVSAWVVGMLSLSSLRQLSVLDAILLGTLLVIVELYVRFRWS